MPRMDGLEVCRRLRAAGDLPILFLSSRDDEIDRVRRAGARRRRLCREALLAARGGRPGQRDPEARRPRAGARPGRRRPVAHNRLRLDPRGLGGATGTARRSPVTVTEFQLLLLLASLPSKVFSRDAIIDRLHGPGFAITDRTIDSHIRNLRHKFAAAGGRDLIETRAGHRLSDRAAAWASGA